MAVGLPSSLSNHRCHSRRDVRSSAASLSRRHSAYIRWSVSPQQSRPFSLNVLWEGHCLKSLISERECRFQSHICHYSVFRIGPPRFLAECLKSWLIRFLVVLVSCACGVPARGFVRFNCTSPENSLVPGHFQIVQSDQCCSVQEGGRMCSEKSMFD